MLHSTQLQQPISKQAAAAEQPGEEHQGEQVRVQAAVLHQREHPRQCSRSAESRVKDREGLHQEQLYLTKVSGNSEQTFMIERTAN